MIYSIQGAFVIDLCTVALCSLIALRCASSFLHPALMILGCHTYIVTVRLFQLLCGATPMWYTLLWPIGLEEVTRAAVASDLALLAMSSAWIVVRFRGRRRLVRKRPLRTLLFVPRVRAAAVLTVLLSAATVLMLGPHRLQMAPTPDKTSGYINSAVGWAPWGCCLLHYLYGFPFPLVCFTLVTLLAWMLLSHYRGVVIIPLVFLLFTWLARRKSGRLPLSLIPAAAILWLMWLPMKPIMYSLQNGKSVSYALSEGIRVAFENFGTEKGSAIDFQFLDMIGSTMTLVDIHGSHYWGSTIAPLFVAPFPRALWPEKPLPAQYQFELDIPSRNMAAMAMTAGLVGESYANFGYFGVIFIPFLVSIAFTSAYSRLAGTPLLSPGSLLYLICLATFMQLYRDGLISAFTFPLVNCAPIAWTAISHWIWPPGQNDQEISHDVRPTEVEYLPSRLSHDYR
jgi:hypothetical protein